ncbi:TonB-dependent receptor domain-containing protein [Niabella sp. CJ426]|uniref:TonB-dependent receptor domain-containing protein n=1 Tax=Niabella sp. CJ426 TaxID=3393740 RepID=UPI003CFE2672
MTRVILFLSALLAQLFCTAQTITIKGTVVDSSDQKPLSGVTVHLAEDNLTRLSGSLTDQRGAFSITLTNKLPVKLTLSHTSYEELEMTLSLHTGSTWNIGTIRLVPRIQSLAAIVVDGRKAPSSFKIDRQVYQASQFGNAANGTGTDVLRNLPSLSVNAQGEIAFRGSGSFLLLLNGKPTQADPALVLGQLPAGSIERVEVITSPGAAYDADGKSGVINIVTKTGVEDGWMVQANIMGGTPPLNDFDNKRYDNPQRHGIDLSTSYNKKKWNWNLGLNYLRNDIAGYREGDVYTINNGVRTSFPSSGERSFWRYNYGGRFSIHFKPDTRNNFTAGFYSGKKFQSRVADLVYHNTRQDLNTGNLSSFTYYNENTQNKEGIFTLANLDYSHDFNEGSKLSFSGLFERADLSGTTYNLNVQYPDINDTIQYTVNPNTNPLNAYRAKLDYQKKIGNGSLQTGYQFRYDHQQGDFFYRTLINGSSQFETDPDFSSSVRVNNRIHAGYVQYNGSSKAFNYVAGLRLEHSERDLLLSNTGHQNQLRLTNLFPSLQIRYTLSEQTVLKAGYSKRVKRTNNFELNPVPEREHSETLEQGDPNLLPEFTSTYEAGIEYSFGKNTLFATLYHQRIANPIQRVNSVFADTILNRVFTNAGRALQTGLEANLNIALSKVWQFVLGGNVYDYQIKGKIFNGALPVQNRSLVYSINSTQSFNLPQNWLLQFSINYISLRATAQGEDGAFLTPHFTVKKTTANKRWYFQFQWLNMDAGLNISNRQRITTWGNDFYTTTHYIYEPDQLQLSVGFNLSRKNRKIVLPQSEMGEKEF